MIKQSVLNAALFDALPFDANGEAAFNATFSSTLSAAPYNLRMADVLAFNIVVGNSEYVL